MNRKNVSIQRGRLLLGCTAALIFMLACSVFTGGTPINTDNSLRLDNGTVEVQDQNGSWTPIAGESTFELVGKLESKDPWQVSGVTLETRDSTQIADNLEVGDLVRVKGVILEDKTWVAYSIGPADTQVDPIVILVGVVDSVDPWVVNGIDLNVTSDTDIQGDITVGMLVRVEILLNSDGTWDVLSIAPLGDFMQTSGCVSVIATIVSINGNEIQFLGWPTTVTLENNTNTQNNNQNNENDNDDQDENQNEDNGESTLNTGQVVLAIVCISGDGTIVITQITILNVDLEVGEPSNNGEKVLVCHKPNKKGGHTLSLPSPAVPAHLAHGDTLGACH